MSYECLNDNDLLFVLSELYIYLAQVMKSSRNNLVLNLTQFPQFLSRSKIFAISEKHCGKHMIKNSMIDISRE